MVEIGFVDQIGERTLPERPEELRKGHRIEEARRDAPDAEGRNLLQRELQQRACRHDAQPRHLFAEVAQRSQDAGRPLDFVEKEQRFARYHRTARERGQFRRERPGRERAVE